MSSITKMGEVEVKMIVSLEKIHYAIIGAFEGGSTYWLRKAELQSSENPRTDFKVVWWGDINIFSGKYTFKVCYDDPKLEEGNGKGKMIVTQDAVAKGLEEMAKHNPYQFGLLLSDQDDATTHDVFMQFVILGEEVYS